MKAHDVNLLVTKSKVDVLIPFFYSKRKNYSCLIFQILVSFKTCDVMLNSQSVCVAYMCIYSIQQWFPSSEAIANFPEECPSPVSMIKVTRGIALFHNKDKPEIKCIFRTIIIFKNKMVIVIYPGNLDSSLCFFQLRVSHEILCK